jgi:hypothetical protein
MMQPNYERYASNNGLMGCREATYVLEHLVVGLPEEFYDREARVRYRAAAWAKSGAGSRTARAHGGASPFRGGPALRLGG